MQRGERLDARTDARVHEQLAQAERGAARIRAQAERRRAREQRVEHVVRVRREAHEEEQRWPSRNSAHDAPQASGVREAARDVGAEVEPAEEEDRERAAEGGEIGENEARDGAIGVAGEDGEGRIKRDGCCERTAVSARVLVCERMEKRSRKVVTKIRKKRIAYPVLSSACNHVDRSSKANRDGRRKHHGSVSDNKYVCMMTSTHR